MKPALPRQRQRGVALMAMLAVLILGATWWTVTALSNSVNRTAEQRAQNAQVLQQAKTAIMGWVAHQTAMTGENNPGRLPCPEPAANIGTANQGLTANTCALPAVGRLPWRTLGLDQLRDASGEPLWYVVSANWTLDGIVANTIINSNSIGALQLDNTGDVVALVIAPGPPLNVTDAACTPRNQVRAVPGNVLDYLECANVDAAPNVFASSGPTGSFNDQVLAITGAELLPLIEAAVAHRFERDMVAPMRNLYTGAPWTNAAVLPFAAPFTDPTAANAFQGTVNTRTGLLPVTISETAPNSGVACTVGAQGPRCAPAFVAWFAATLAGAGLNSPTCDVVTDPRQITCVFYRRCFIFCGGGNVAFTLTADAANVGMAWRQLNQAVAMNNVNAAPRNYVATLNYVGAPNAGAARIVLNAQATVAAGGGFGGALGDLLCGLLGFLQVCKQETISVPITLFADHPIFDPANGNFSWFFRNNWHQVSYYAAATETTPGGGGCGALGTCLTVNSHNTNTGPHAGLIIISGRSLTGAARPNGTAEDWLENTNCDFGANPTPPPAMTCMPDVNFAVRVPPLQINRQFNDRIAVLGP